VVTGSTRGIGRAIAEAYAAAGAMVVVNGRNPQQAQSAGTLTVAADVSKAADVERLMQIAVATFGRIDILVNNAGISPYYKPAETMTEAEWDEIIRVNLKGVFLCCQAAGRIMISQKS